MVDRTEPTFDAVEQALRDAGLPGEAAEIHGELCARLCLLGQEAGLPWVASVVGDVEARETAITLEALAARTSVALDAGDMSFLPLLPPDDVALEIRAEHLGLWCQGFLHGLSLGGDVIWNASFFKDGPTRGVIEDFVQIAKAAFSPEETEEEGEAAYVEVFEYVRVSVQLVFEEMTAGRSSSAGSATH